MGVNFKFKNLKADFANKRIPIAVKPARRNADQLIPNTDLRTIHDFAVVNDTDGEPRQIIFILLIKPRHFSGFTTDEGTARFIASIGYPFYDFSCNFGFQFSH